MRWHPGMEYRETRSYQRILYIFERPRAGTVLRDQKLWVLLRAGVRHPLKSNPYIPMSTKLKTLVTEAVSLDRKISE